MGQFGFPLFCKKVFSLFQLLIFSFCFLLFLLLWGRTIFASLCTFRLLLARIFFGCSFSFHTASCSAFIFLWQFFGGQFGFLFFQKTVFKIMPGFAVLAFCCGGFWWTRLVYFMPANFVLGYSNSFYANSFTFSNCLRFLIHCSLCFICCSFMVAASTLHGVWR